MVTKHSTPVSSESSTCSENCWTSFSLTHILLIIIIFLNAFGIYLLTGNSVSLPGLDMDSFGMKQAFLEIEYDKAGGKENYELLTRAQRLSLNDPQNPSNIKSMKQYIDSFGSGGVKQATQDADANVAPTTLEWDKLKTVLDGAALQWNKDADIAVIEYSDMECPFCVRQYQDTKLWPKLQAQYWDKVKFAFKNNRGVNHEWTEAKAIGALCAKKIGWDDAYVKFYTTIMDGSTQSNWVFNVANLPDAAKAAGIDEAKWKSCFDAKETQDQFAQETNEAQSFGLGWTPWTLILNIKTGKYLTVEGAYPFESFTQKIDSLMN